jgi:hypothetical protein
VIDPAAALASTESALRHIVRSVLGDVWIRELDAEKRAALESKRTAEDKKRDGVTVSTDLLDYTEFYTLTELILKQWDQGFGFKPVFDDKTRTQVFFSFVEDMRNAIAHSRELVIFERELLSGISNLLRNQVVEFRTRDEPASAHYPVVESVRDDSGKTGSPGPTRRLEVGQQVRFTARGIDPKGRDLQWALLGGLSIPSGWGPGIVQAFGNAVELIYEVRPTDVGEEFWIRIDVSHTGPSPHHRHSGLAGKWDDSVTFAYAVNPPD